MLVAIVLVVIVVVAVSADLRASVIPIVAINRCR